MPNNLELKFAYQTFLLEFPWDYYLTQTFRIPRKDPARAAARVNDVLASHFGCTRAFYAVEPHSTGDLHLHALLRCLQTEDWQTLPNGQPRGAFKYLHKAFGRLNFENIDTLESVVKYCAKYVLKGDGDQFYFFGDKSAWLLDK